MRPQLPLVLSLLLISSTAAVPGQTVFPGQEWEFKSPASQGVSSETLEVALDHLREHSGRDGISELVIVRNGYVIWKGDNAGKVHGIWSGTKSFTSTCLGLLIDDRKCELDSRAAEFVPDLSADYPTVTLKHFATMTSGYRAQGDEPRGGYTHGPSKTPFLPSPHPLFAPGSHYAYWDSAMNEFALVLTAIAGEPLEALFKKRIADPIQMNPAGWRWKEFTPPEQLPVNGGAGNNSKHIEICALEMARFGWLFLNNGNWNGTQLISRAWVETATSVQVPASLPLKHRESGIAGPGQYGLNWWVNGTDAEGRRKWPGAPHDTFAASGFNNNDMFVIPSWNMVIIRLGLDQGDHAITDAEYSRFIELVGASFIPPK